MVDITKVSTRSQPKNVIEKMFTGALFVRVLSAVTALLATVIAGIIISQYLGADAMASYGLTMPLLFLLPAVGGMISSGAQKLCGNSIGRGDIAATNRTFSVSIIVGIVFSAIVGIVLFSFADTLAFLCGAKGDAAKLLAESSAYLRGYAIGAPGVVFVLLMIPFLQLDGEKARVAIAALSMTVADIVFDLMNVFIFKKGLFGMAIASSLSAYIAAAVMLSYFLRKNRTFHLKLKDWGGRLAASVLKEGMPFTFRQICAILRSIALNRVFIHILPIELLAVFTVISTFRSIFMTVGTGIGDTTLMLTGVLSGEEDRNGIWKLLKASVKYSVILNVLLIVAVCIFASPLIKVFIPATDPLFVTATTGLRLFILSTLPFSIHYAYRCYMQGMGKTGRVMFLTLLNELVLSVASAYFLSIMFAPNPNGMWLSFFVQELVTLFITFVMIWVMSKHIAFRQDTVLQVDDGFGVEESELMEKELFTLEDVNEFSKKIHQFCIDKGADKKRALVVSLCVEEIGINIVKYGLQEGKDYCCDVRTYFKNNTWALRFRDDCAEFDPISYMKDLNGNEKNHHFGIRMALSLSKDVSYIRSLNMNNLFIKM